MSQTGGDLRAWTLCSVTLTWSQRRGIKQVTLPSTLLLNPITGEEARFRGFSSALKPGNVRSE